MANNFINQFPYTDFHELNLDWVIKRTKELEETTAYLVEEFGKITVLTEEYIQQMINTAIETNNIVLYQRMLELKNDITLEYKGYVTAQINALKIYIDNQDLYFDNQAKGYAASALADAKTYTDGAVLDYTMMINPITGEYEDVRNVVDDIVSYFHTENSLTAGEYDGLELTAGAYDAYDISAYDYDFNGKTILMP